jgi:predicted nucleotidyltransferase
MQQLMIDEPPSELSQLQKRLAREFINIEYARRRARLFREQLEAGLAGMTSSDVSIVVFGSLARDEFTEGSDVDWTLLIDGVADPKHLEVGRQVKDVLAAIGARPPGREGIFGNVAFSHNIIHQIGGEDDTNSNTTRRILLILESKPLGRHDAYDRVLNQILTRYIAEDGRFLQSTARFHVPRFLLNDFARYWRTMAVDFAYKRRTRGGDGSAIRNIKLRMSRKLIFVSGLLTCFSLHLLMSEPERRSMLSTAYPAHEFVRHMRVQLARTPLEILASVINGHDHLSAIGLRLFGAYDEFLAVLGDPEKRNHLDRLVPGSEDGDPAFEQLRDASHSFRDALLELFFDDRTDLVHLTKTYGVF